MAKRCQTSNQTVATAMRPLFESNEVKGSFFLVSLPDTMDHIIDNLSTWNITSFAAIEPKMLNIADKHSIDSIDSSAYNVTARRSKPSSTSTKPTKPSTTQPECTYCRKRNFTYVRHLYKDY